MVQEFHSNGKLLITAEYAILDGAMGLALPTRYGQGLKVSSEREPKIYWKSFDWKGNIWFTNNFDIPLGEETQNGPLQKDPVSQTLLKILLAAKRLNPHFLREGTGYHIETYLDFPENWGLGSSSTLINNIAQWAQVDAFDLLWASFPGSGYDIACAQRNKPLLYQLRDKRPFIEEIDFKPPFAHQLYFLHLNKKQDSREGMLHYNTRKINKEALVMDLSEITQKMLYSNDLETFGVLMGEHEDLLGDALCIVPIKKRLFPTFNGAIKSLGAWGGDFVLVAHREDPSVYFRSKGYDTLIPYKDMVL
jgi:mevalonate kinase